MKYDEDRIDEATMALLHLVMFKDGPNVRAWKSFDWETMDRLFEKGWICDPKSKAKSVFVTEEGAAKAKALFEKFFARIEPPASDRSIA